MCLPADSVSLSGADTLPPIGGASILISGQFLGVNASVIRLRYVGGLPGQPRRDYFARSCAVVTPLTQVSCVSAPGIGGNFTFQIIVDEGASAFSTQVFSHSPPSVLSLASSSASGAPSTVRTVAVVSDCGDCSSHAWLFCSAVGHSRNCCDVRCTLQGGATMQLRGVNFGLVNAGANLVAWCYPTSTIASSDQMLFYAENCTVTRDDAVITCRTPSAVGSSLTWGLEIDGIAAVLPTFAIAQPVITAFVVVSPSIP